MKRSHWWSFRPAHGIIWGALAVAAAAPPALAADCPFLTREQAAAALTALPPAPRVADETPPVKAGGLKRTRTCYFALPDDGIGLLTIMVAEFESRAAAQAAFERQRKSAPEGARPLKGLGQAAFMASSGGGRFADTTYVWLDHRLLRVNHVFGKAAKAAVERDPDGAVIGTHEIARQVLKRL